MNAKQRLLYKLDNLHLHNYTDSVFKEILVAVTEYMRETGEYSLDIALNQVLHKSALEEKAIRVIEQSGIEVAIDFLNVDECDYTRDYFWDSGYGIIRNLETSDLEKVVNRIKKRLEDLDDGDEENDPGNET